MKRVVIVGVVLLVVVAVMYRQRLFLRDPLGKVERNGMRVDGARVFINYYNDVLLENDNPPMLVMVVEKDQPVGVPTKLRCIHWLACLTDADAASALPLNASIQSMSGKEARFRDESGRPWVITLH